MINKSTTRSGLVETLNVNNSKKESFNWKRKMKNSMQNLKSKKKKEIN